MRIHVRVEVYIVSDEASNVEAQITHAEGKTFY
jgi:hypothetical protein